MAGASGTNYIARILRALRGAPVPRDRRSLWRAGEDAAARYLRRQRFKILERNVRLGRNEIDIIARDGDTVVFVEVRTRAKADEVFRPEDSIDPRKQHHLRTAAHWYIARHPDPECYYRFDVVAVILPENGKAHITHYRDAFPG